MSGGVDSYHDPVELIPESVLDELPVRTLLAITDQDNCSGEHFVSQKIMQVQHLFTPTTDLLIATYLISSTFSQSPLLNFTTQYTCVAALIQLFTNSSSCN